MLLFQFNPKSILLPTLGESLGNPFSSNAILEQSMFEKWQKICVLILLKIGNKNYDLTL